MLLYRPVGLYELEKILDAEGKRFLPRLEFQPIFYPVLNIEYARQIARDWNTVDTHSGFVGYVTRFEVDDEYISKFEVMQVGDVVHKEYWIDANELDEFNSHIIGSIKIVEAYYGDSFEGVAPTGLSGFKEKDVHKQFDIFEQMMSTNGFDFSATAAVEWKIVNLNYLLWKETKSNPEVLNQLLASLNRNDKCFLEIE